MAFVDFVRAKALFSLRVEAIVPEFENRTIMRWRQAKHPLLYLSLKANGKVIVPAPRSLFNAVAQTPDDLACKPPGSSSTCFNAVSPCP